MKNQNQFPPDKDKKNIIQEVPTDADTNNKSIDGEDFGPTGQEQGQLSETEKRKNVNADPNLIQGNKLGEEKEEKK